MADKEVSIGSFELDRKKFEVIQEGSRYYIKSNGEVLDGCKYVDADKALKELVKIVSQGLWQERRISGYH